LKSESELLTGPANAIVKTSEFHARDGGTYSQGGCQVNRVKGTHRFRRKRTPCSVVRPAKSHSLPRAAMGFRFQEQSRRNMSPAFHAGDPPVV